MATNNPDFLPGYLLGCATSILAKSIDTLLLAQPWIYSPCSSMTPDQALPSMLPSPLTTTLLYAVAETLFLRFYIWISISPSVIILPCLIWHSTIINLLAARLQEVQEERPRNPPDNNPDQNHNRRPTSLRLLSNELLISTLTAAGSNAGILLFFRSLPAKRWQPEIGNWKAFNTEVLSVVFYLVNFPGDLTVASKAGDRAQFLGQKGLFAWETTVQIGSLLVLHGVKMAVRRILRVDVWIAFTTLPTARAEELFGYHRYKWLDDAFERFAPMWWWRIICLSIAAFSFHLLIRMYRPHWWEAVRLRSWWVRFLLG